MFQSLAEGNIVDQLRTGVMPIYIYSLHCQCIMFVLCMETLSPLETDNTAFH